jgi:methionyl-tRNA formyltransferase
MHLRELIMAKKRVLFLGPAQSPLLAWLLDQGEDVVQRSTPLNADFITGGRFSFLVSYGYRHIIKKDILVRFPGRAINLHISYLPWNRGADPNFWSFVEDTPKGVSIHYLDEGIDTGDIIEQKEISFDMENETLATSYARLQQEIQELFKQNWRSIKEGSCNRKKQVGKGSMHRIKDIQAKEHLLINGWDTPVEALREKGL